MEPPQIRIVRGSPTPEEEEAARNAILQLWREDQAAAARGSGLSPWVLAGRAQATRRDATVSRQLNPARAWRTASHLDPSPSLVR